MLAGAMAEAVGHGLNPVQVLLAMPYLIPPTLPYTIPCCLLFACTVVYGGMSGTNEITAIKAAGISVFRALTPAIVLGVAASALCLWLSDHFIPQCNRGFAQRLASDLQGTIYAYLSRMGSINESDFPYEIYVHSVRGDKLIRPIFKHRNAAGYYDMVAQASEATLRVLPAENGNDARVVLFLKDGAASTDLQSTAYFRDRTQEMPVPSFAKQGEEKNENLAIDGCLALAAERIEKAAEIDFELSLTAIDSVLTGRTFDFGADLPERQYKSERFYRKARESEAEMHIRLSQSTTGLPFVLLGCPVSMLFRRRDFLQTFFVCFLPIVLLYYPALILTANVFKETYGIPPAILWLPGTALTLAALPLLRHIRRY